MLTKSVWFRHLHYLLFALLAFTYLFELRRVSLDYHRSEKVINEDAFGYYLLLPAIFKYHDPEFAFLDTVLRKTETYSNYIPPVVNTISGNERVCKYYSGVALLELPFYLTADALLSQRGKYNGFESPYHLAMLLSAAFYLIVALYRLMKAGIKLGLHPVLSAVLPALPLFGSNLFIYASYDIGYSHVYSFFALSCYTEALIDLKQKPAIASAFRTGLFLGLTMLIRPFNGIALLFLPIVFSIRDLKSAGYKNSVRYFAYMAAGTLLMLSIQSALWYWQTGRWYVYPYTGESLNLLNPRLFEFVFGYDSGWALYSPLPFAMLLIAMAALAASGKYRQALWVTICAFAILYLLSCWYFLHYGCTAGCRPITEFYAPLLLLFIYAGKPWLRSKVFVISVSVLLGCLFWYSRIVQYQFLEHIINWCEMNKARFNLVFLKTHDAYKYSSSDFWDFSAYKEKQSFNRLETGHSLSIGPEREQEEFDLNLPALDAKDSVLLFSIRIETDGMADPGETYLRMLLTDNGAYVDLHNVLISKLQNGKTWQNSREYDFHVSRTLQKGKIHFTLASAGGKPVCGLLIKHITIRRILL